MTNAPRALVRGGGDLATGVAARLHRAGFAVLVTEIEQPLAVRRLVALAEAVFAGQTSVEDLRGVRISQFERAEAVWVEGGIPVLVDPSASVRARLQPALMVDGRMRKTAPDLDRQAAPLVIGLGPGFEAGTDCHAVVETQRGHHLGRVFWRGQAAADSGVPEPVAGFDHDRVLRAPVDGTIRQVAELGSVIEQGELIATVEGEPISAPFVGALRGLLHDGLTVAAGTKVGDLDPRADPSYCTEISDKALAIGGGVLEAALSQPEIRRQLAIS